MAFTEQDFTIHELNICIYLKHVTLWQKGWHLLPLQPLLVTQNPAVYCKSLLPLTSTQAICVYPHHQVQVLNSDGKGQIQQHQKKRAGRAGQSSRHWRGNRTSQTVGPVPSRVPATEDGIDGRWQATQVAEPWWWLFCYISPKLPWAGFNLFTSQRLPISGL